MTDCKVVVAKKTKTPLYSSMEAWPRHLPNYELAEGVEVGVARRRSGLLGTTIPLSMSRTTTSNATEGVSAQVDLVITCKATVTPASGPSLEGQTAL